MVYPCTARYVRLQLNRQNRVQQFVLRPCLLALSLHSHPFLWKGLKEPGRSWGLTPLQTFWSCEIFLLKSICFKLNIFFLKNFSLFLGKIQISRRYLLLQRQGQFVSYVLLMRTQNKLDLKRTRPEGHKHTFYVYVNYGSIPFIVFQISFYLIFLTNIVGAMGHSFKSLYRSYIRWTPESAENSRKNTRPRRWQKRKCVLGEVTSASPVPRKLFLTTPWWLCILSELGWDWVIL